MWTTARSLALLAVAVPATAYVVLETVVEESATASRPVVVLERAGRTQPASDGDVGAGRPGDRDGGADGGRQPAGSPGSTRPADGTSCDDGSADDRTDDLDDDLDEDRDDGTDDDDDVAVVRPCPTDVREDDRRDGDDDVEDD